MTISGSYDWTATRDDIITRAARILGQLGRGETASASQLSEGASVLNAMVKEWQNRGVLLWKEEWLQQALTASTQKLGSDGLNYTCILGHTSATATNKPITGTNYTAYWYQTGSTGDAWTNAQAYTCAGDFTLTNVLSIQQAFMRSSTGIDTQLAIIDREQYMRLGNKATFGTPTNLWLETALTRKVHLFPIPTDTTQVLHYLAITKVADFDGATDNADFPVGWIKALVWGVADEWGAEVGVEAGKQDRITKRAIEAFIAAKAGDQPNVSSYYAYPDLRK